MSSDSDSDNDPYMRAIMERVMARAAEQDQQPPEEVVPRPIHRRRYVPRDHAGAHNRLVEDYFADYPRWGPTVFRRQFRMRRELFLRIVDGLSARYVDFQQQWDAAGKPGFTPLQKCTAAIRQLAYGGTADMFDEYLHVSDSAGRKYLKQFCKGVIETFGPTYLRNPTADDCQYLLNLHGRKHGFPGMLGSIDCMHWQWKNCPTRWRGQFTNGYKGSHPTMILEAVADQRLWIWHAFFGVAGANNDLNVLNCSPLFNRQCNGVGPLVNFTANGKQYNMGYYLADGIYPNWPVFVKTISCPTDDKRRRFAMRQEAARKDVERAFGVLQARFALVKGPARFFYKDDICDIMYAAIVLHNMIVDDQYEDVEDVPDEDRDGQSNAAGPSNSSGRRHGVATESHRQGVPLGYEQFVQGYANIRQRELHHELQRDLIEEIYARDGH